MKIKKEWFTREFLTERTIWFSFASMLFNFFNGVAKVIISIFQTSFYFGLNGAYNIVMGSAKMNAVKKYNDSQNYLDEKIKTKIENKTCYNLCRFAVATSLIYLVFSIVTTFFVKDYAEYGIVMVLYIATMAFCKIITSIISAIKTRKDVSLIIHYIKLINLADGFIAIALTQRAILFMMQVANANLYSSIGCLVFSIIAFAVSIFMIIELKYIKKRKFY